MSDQEKNMYLIDDGESWWIVDVSPHSALASARKMDIGTELHAGESISIELLDPSGKLSVTMVDGLDETPAEKCEPAPAVLDEKTGYWRVTATVQEWIDITEIGHVVCSTVY